MSNVIAATLAKIIGQESIPKGATSFSTHKAHGLHLVSFVIGKTGNFEDVEITQEQHDALAKAELAGSFGWALS